MKNNIKDNQEFYKNVDKFMIDNNLYYNKIYKDNQEFYKNVDKFMIDNNILYYNKIYRQQLYPERLFIVFIYKSYCTYQRIGNKHHSATEKIKKYPKMKNPFIENIKYEI